jgi:hypothetical protein
MLAVGIAINVLVGRCATLWDVNSSVCQWNFPTEAERISVFRERNRKIIVTCYGMDSLCVCQNISVLTEFLHTKGTENLKHLWAHAEGTEENSESISHLLIAHKYKEHC